MGIEGWTFRRERIVSDRRMKTIATVAMIALLFGFSASLAMAEVIFMSEEWAEAACEAWNEDAELTGNLTQWMENDLDRGYKIIQIYRLDCEESPKVEIRLEGTDEGVQCTQGGLAEAELDLKADYVMFAKTERWEEMGAGDYGPMKGMMTRRLRFQGPKWEAMNNMGPFKNFLLLTGQIPGDTSSCPTS